MRVVLLPRAPFDIAGNLLLLVPLTVGLAAGLRGWRRPLVTVLLAAAALEGGQMLVRGRVVSPADVALNVIGAAAALAALGRARRSGLGRSRALLLAALATSATTILVLVWGALRVDRSLAPENWNSWYEIVAGDEVTGGRRYVGEIASPRICGGPGSSEVCLSPSADQPARARLVDVVERSRVLDLEATVRSASDEQSGPTRIVTFSADGSERNATLGQEGRSLILRIRSPRAGPNGADLELELPEAIPAGEWLSVAGGQTGSTLWLRAGERRFAFRPSLLDAWLVLSPRERLRPAGIELARVLGALVLFVPAAWLARFAAGSRRSTPAWLATAAFGAAVTLVGWGLVSGSAPGLTELVLGALAASLGVALAAGDLGRPAGPRLA